MAWWNRAAAGPASRIAPETLAEVGKLLFLGDAYAGPLSRDSLWSITMPFMTAFGSPERSDALTELREKSRVGGPWHRVGAWQIVREYESHDSIDTDDITAEGYHALLEMRVLNVQNHLSMRDAKKWRRLIGSPPPSDGFFGQPIFDSPYGPSRHDYFARIVHDATRPVRRLAETAGVAPGDLSNAAQSVWSFALLIYRGAARIGPEIREEYRGLAAAIGAATGVDHAQFVDHLARTVLDGQPLWRDSPWPAIGGARFAEEYLQPHATAAVGFGRLLDFGLRGLVEGRLLDVDIPSAVLTVHQRQRLAQWLST